MTETGYEKDFYAWLLSQATHLRARQWAALDIDNLAEEIEDLGRSERHALWSHLRILLLHLLKWAYQPERRSRSWRGSVTRARQNLARRLRQSPSLRPDLPEFMTEAYADARRLAADQTGLPLATFPETCPWSLDQLQDLDFLPEG